MKTPQEMHDLYEAEYREVRDSVVAVSRVPEWTAEMLGLKEKAIRRATESMDKVALEGYCIQEGVSSLDSSMRGVMFIPLPKEQHQEALEKWKKKKESERKEQESGLSI